MINRKTLFLVLTSLLVFYILLIAFLNDGLKGDEHRYMRYAKNLTEGFYTSSDNPDLSNGPGYPLLLYPFVWLESNLLLPRLLNGFFVLFGVLYFYKATRLYLSSKKAMVFTLLLGLYPPLLYMMPSLLSESLSFLLVNGFIYHFCAMFVKKIYWKNCLLSSFFLGFLILTKVIFFHVMLVSAVAMGFVYLVNRQRSMRWVFLCLVGSFLFTSPFLIYAYGVTGKVFYLGTRGGELLYHRSTPFDNEYGNWFASDRILGLGNKETEEYQRLKELRLNHGEFYRSLQPLSNIERDNALRAKAIENMKKYPKKYVKNTLASVGRLFFNIPNSYKNQGLSSYGYIIPNGIILFLLIMIARPAYVERKRIPFEIKAVFVFALIYGFGIILLLGKPRYFIMMVPSFLLFLAFTYSNLVTIKIGKEIDQLDEELVD